jgi:glutamate--cysteine ligase
LGEYEPIAAALDDAHRSNTYRDALSAAGAALADPASTRSARMLAEMGQTYDNAYVGFALAQSLRHRRTLLDLPLAAEVEARFARMAEDSLAAQRRIEAADSLPFETYRQQYLSRDLLSGAQLRSQN